MSVDQSSQPPWFTEGIAELFSTFERRGDKVAWGQPINEHIALLRGGEEVPLAQFLIEPSALFDRDSHTSRFYAQAWAFTHYLMFSKDPTRRQSLISFLTTFKTQSGEATVKAVFGASLPDVEHDFHVYIDQRSWTYMIQPLKPAPDPPPMQPATPELIEASLGYLALGAGRQDLARQHAEKAVDLDPAAAEGHAILAYQALDASHYELAATHAEAALDRGSKDSQLFMLLGDSYLEGSNSNKPDAARTGATLYENAINLSLPRAAEYERLTEALFAVEKPRAEDAKFLQNGMHVFPGDDWLRVGSAVVEYRLGHADVALTTMDAALRPESKLDPQQRDYATNLRGGWLMTTMQSQVRDAVEKRDFAAARAVVSQYRERIGDAPQLQKFMQDTDDRLALNQVVAQFDSLMRDKKKAEARAVGEQLLARPNVPDAMRRYVQQRLGGGS
jgi:tetratricopeptide (TPR) repeat protein